MVSLTIDGRRISVEPGTTMLGSGPVARHPHPDHVPRAGDRAGIVVLPLRGPDRRAPHALARLRHARRGGHGSRHRERGRPRGAQDGAGASALRPRRRVRRAVRGRVSGRARHSGIRLWHRDGGHAPLDGSHRGPAGAARFARAHLPAFVRAAMPPMRISTRAWRSALCTATWPTWTVGPRTTCRRARHPPGNRLRSWARGPRVWPPLTIFCNSGHDCTLFDAHPLPGGMLRYGIPANRLPKDALDAEIDAVRRLGARFRMGERWGEHFTLAGLRERHDAVFVAIGAQRAQGLRCEGEQHALAGIAFLERVAKGEPVELGNHVAVIGGGNTAMDCARSAVRLGARNVRVLYRRSRQEMPSLMEEVEAAEAEGVQIDLLVAPVRLEPSGRSLLLTCQRMTLGEPDASGRRRPVEIDGSDFTIECSTAIAATGQSVERSLAEREGLAVTAWGIAADEKTLATNLPARVRRRRRSAGRGSRRPRGGRGKNGGGLDPSVSVGRNRHRGTGDGRHRHAPDGRCRAGRHLPLDRAGRARACAGDPHGAAPGELRRGGRPAAGRGRRTGGSPLPHLRLPQSGLLPDPLAGHRIRRG